MALCGLHHWTFDEGLLSITDTYRICISPLTTKMQGSQEALASFSDQPVIVPKEKKIWPSKQALRWHRENIYRNHSHPRLF